MINPHTVSTNSPPRNSSRFSCFSFLLLAICATFFQRVDAATPDEWRSRSIYQVITDRFARTDGSTTAECEVFDNAICGGTWQGLINHLDYIQDMGFTAVRSSLNFLASPRQTREKSQETCESIMTDICGIGFRSGYLLWSRIFPMEPMEQEKHITVSGH